MKKVIYLAVLLWAGLAATAMWSQTSDPSKAGESKPPKTEEATAPKAADVLPDANTPLPLTNATIQLSGASSGNVNVSDQLDYDVSGASNLSYHGRLNFGKQERNGASSVTQK